MVSTSLRQFLQSLCCNSPWDYAVFWKFQQHQNEMLLLWEDGLFDFSRPIDPVNGTVGSHSFNNSCERLSSTCASDTRNADVDDCPIEVAMAEMSSTYYIVGKGLIGEVAYTESPSWIFIDNFMANGFNSDVVSECFNPLLHQFAAGVKTMLLVPLIPHGVLQLGSLDVVHEDSALVISVINKFYAHLQFATCFSPLKWDRNFPVQPTEVVFTCMKNSGESCRPTIEIAGDLKVLGTVGIEGQQMSITSHVIPMVQDSLQMLRKDMTKVIGKVSESRIQTDSSDLIDVAEPFNHEVWENFESEMIKDRLESSCLDEGLECLFNFGGYDTRSPDNSVCKIMQSNSNDVIVGPSIRAKDCRYASHGWGSQNLKFPLDSELHKALGHVLLNHRDSNLSDENPAASYICKGDVSHIDDTSTRNYGRQCPSKNKTENLLEAVVNASSISDDNSSNRGSHCVTSFRSSSVKLGSSQVEHGDITENNHVALSSVTSAFSGDQDLTLEVNPSASSFGCIIDASLLERQPWKCENLPMRPTKGSKFIDASKRKARSGENKKPRPRDRQLIQDRIKELRGLVPNGAKCSIDGLLDRTIKHMEFLAGVTDHANRIRKHAARKVSIQEDVKSPKVENNKHSGASWALEFENERQTCPIMVKDLEYTGHMLIEMLCNDHGRFLEIADVLHRLELKILKGAMERRSDENAWAHFIVEASESFHRLDIFWPLMQLLQQSATQISSKI